VVVSSSSAILLAIGLVAAHLLRARAFLAAFFQMSSMVRRSKLEIKWGARCLEMGAQC